MRPEIMRLRRALAGTFVAILVATGMVAVSPALSASAHHNTVSVSASCVDYKWTINWRIVNSEWDKSEKITDSTDSAVISVGTVIEKSGVYTKSETVSGPVTKTLTVKAEWSNGVKNTNSATVRPGDFAGTCERPPSVPKIALIVPPCTVSGALGAVSVTLSNLDTGATYAITLYSEGGTALESVDHTATAATASVDFTDQAPGTYYATVQTSSGTVLTTSADAIIGECSPNLPSLSVTLEPCVALSTLGTTQKASPAAAAEREISVRLDGLSPSVVYTVTLVDADPSVATPIDSVLTPGGADASFTHIFTNVPSPGEYAVTVTAGSNGAVSLISDAIEASLCELPTLALPTIEAFVDQCDVENGAPGSLSVLVGDLDTTKTYYVRIVDGAGNVVPGGEDQLVSGLASSTLTFPNIVAPGSFTAELLVDPGKQLAATAPNAVSLDVCLPTLAITGPGVLIPLGSFAALLLTLGGAVVTGRLRRRVTL